MTFICKDLRPETWGDFETLFGKHKGVRGGCWCTYFRCTSVEFEGMTREERKAFQKDLVEQNRGHGVFVYDGNTPVAWCQFGPPEEFPRYDRMRAYQKLDLKPDEMPRWRISCLFVDKHRRKEGLSKMALQAALEKIKESGGGIVEAFPLNLEKRSQPPHTGSVDMYIDEGFQTVAPLGKNILLMRRTL